ncbi:MAG: hypothetical protein A3H42_00385 [Deltaproteobacteria bacterium RIFCSPLOWO2_02_FULL_46_8]|nr:MAG: hypothetical protein A3H42_00385 [Deltaproteobacteria bacterium RIFCSPLOWO2_02_FULL_46_8]
MLEKMANFERSITPDKAEKIISRAVEQLSDRYCYKFNHYKKKTTDIVHVEDVDGKEIVYGLGKGIYSKLGAYGECLEHLFYRDLGKRETKQISVDEFKKSAPFNQDIVLQYAYTLGGAPHSVNCILFNELRSNEVFWVPDVYINYHFFDRLDQRSDFDCFLGKYVTTSGTAFALTREDAFLHALNETIERDLTSEFFLELSDLKYGVKNDFYQVSLNTLPDHLQSSVKDIQNRYQPATIEIYMSQTIFNVWWSFCVVRFNNACGFLLPIWGAGCSVLHDLAIYRSISECIQMLDNYEIENEKSDRALLNFVQKFPKFRKIAFLETENKFKEKEYDKNNNVNEISVSDQIKYITKNMNHHGFYPSMYVSSDINPCYLACAYTPNLERFYNITKSMMVLPIKYIKNYV